MGWQCDSPTILIQDLYFVWFHPRNASHSGRITHVVRLFSGRYTSSRSPEEKRRVSLCSSFLSAQPSHGQPATNPMTLSATARCAMCSAEVQRVPAERRDFVRSRRLESVGYENPGGFMTRKLDSQEPLLNTVARKLGQAAGTLANLTHKLTTEQTAAAASQSTPKPESMNPGPAGAGSARRGSDRPGSGTPRSANSGSVQPQKNRAAQQSQGTRKTRAAASGTASRQGTLRTKSRSRRKG
jgi:hypothetical protein